ncbi:MAG: multi-sensor hybrid histidine kinase, partial [Phycisphaerales bacterium]|nr:multi-sensor hybrid histidine kinase [Phycisphaerales bacterium]
MLKPPPPADEAARLAALRAYDILDTPDEAAFDDLTRLAARICGTPISLVSLVDADRQWFKSRVGLDVAETPRDLAFCGHAILGQDLFVVPDAARDDRFADNPLVAGDPHVRFYAGAPLVGEGGQALGTLCVIDRVPRELTPDQADALRALARQAMSQIRLRRSVAGLTLALVERAEAERAVGATHDRLRRQNAALVDLARQGVAAGADLR